MDSQGQETIGKMKYADESSEDKNPQTVTLDDVKNATPKEEEAETSILKAIEESDIIAEQPDVLQSLHTVSPSTSNEESEDKSNAEKPHTMLSVAMEIRAMHREASAVEVCESKETVTPDVATVEKAGKGFRNSINGAMNTTTNAMVANANILLKRKAAKENEEIPDDIECGEQSNEGALHPKKSDDSPTPSSHRHTKIDHAKEEVRKLYQSLKPEGSRMMKQIKLALFVGIILFLTSIISFNVTSPGDNCFYVPEFIAPTLSPTVSPSSSPSAVPTTSLAPSYSPTFSPTSSPTVTSSVAPSQATAAPTAAPVAAQRRRLQEERWLQEEPAYSKEIEECTTISWICLFLIRLMVTYFLAFVVQMIVIDVICLQYHWVTRWLGPMTVLGIIQSKGWPFIITAWSILNFALCYGNSNFAKHWLHWQDVFDIFTWKNPAGNFTHSTFWLSTLLAMLLLGIFTAFKRLAFGLMFGRQSYNNFNQELTEIMEQILLIGNVANLAKKVQMNLITRSILQNSNSSSIDWGAKYSSLISSRELSIDPEQIDEDDSDVELETEDLTATERANIIKLVGDWEEPKMATYSSSDVASLDDIIHFSQTLAYINNTYPFTISFGNARTREACVQSAVKVFERLQIHTNSNGSIPFETISIAARDKRGNIDEEHVKRLIRAFRPDREGNLSLLDFVKSCDSVYKKLRLLQASIKNASQIDNAAERIYNVIFYFFYIVFIQTMFLGLNTASEIIVGVFALITPLSFAISSACGKYVEGVMLVLYRNPFGIGDRIALSEVDVDTSKTGSSTWFVENVDLFTTTVRYSITNEVATLANSALAPCRIINANRSPNAVVRVTLRFGVDIPNSKIEEFTQSVEKFVKDKPREFLQLNGLSACSIEVERGFVEYILSVQHLESWQNMGAVWQSKVALTRFCHEESKRLEMRFTRPVLPVTVKVAKDAIPSSELKDIAGADTSDD